MTIHTIKPLLHSTPIGCAITIALDVNTCGVKMGRDYNVLRTTALTRLEMDRIECSWAKDIGIPELDPMVDRKRAEWKAEIVCTVLNLVEREMRVVMLYDKTGESRQEESGSVIRP